MAIGTAFGQHLGHRFKQFPLGRTGVLLPTANRRAAALGICLYTASRPTVLRIQQLAFVLTRVLGARILPGASRQWTPDLDLWEDLLSTWQKEIGPFDGFAVYHRRQTSRTGLTILLVNNGTPLAVAKIRDNPLSLDVEQRALDAVRQKGVEAFRVPEALGTAPFGDDLAWSAQTAVFTAPHRPVFTAPPRLFVEVSEALATVVKASPSERAAHNDLTPWNLRIDHEGQMWLFDWEDVGAAPVDSDRCYFGASSYALRGTYMPEDLPSRTLDYWALIVSARRSESGSDRRLADSILEGLDIARAARRREEIAVDTPA